MSTSAAPNARFLAQNLFSVSDRVILITGGGSGLGSYAAIGLALNGAKVYIAGRRKEKLEEVVKDFKTRAEQDEEVKKQGGGQGQIIPIPGDVSTKEGIAQLVKDYSKVESHLDVLINGAGILGPKLQLTGDDKNDTSKVHSALWEEEWDVWSNTLNTNTISPWFTTVAFIPLLDKATKPSLTDSGAHVINITSISAHHIDRSTPNTHSYQVSKTAEERLTRILSGRLTPYGVRCSSIAPGIFPSEMTQFAQASDGDKGKQIAPAVGRSGTPEDFVGTVLYMSSRAGAYLNGACLIVDGGRVLARSAA
ncbi:unnamed protein product [Sympodiomycopsis kandeliae]